MSSVPDTPIADGPRELHFIFGVAPRSGTTYLGDLLALHPDCGQPTDLPEDGFLQSFDKLEAYTGDLEKFWRSWPDLPLPTVEELNLAIGTGLVDIITSRTDSRVAVSKTPFPTNLHRLPELFPESRAVVIVRDGRSVTESMIRTWGMKFDMAAARFRDGARSILEAIPNPAEPPTHLWLVTYEDLFTDTQTVLGDVLEFFGLDPEMMPADAITDLPVRGSSTARGDATANDEVHWEAIDRPEGFNPLDRWAQWTDRQHRMFAAVAGAENEGLGYASSPVGLTDRVLDNFLGVRRGAIKLAREAGFDTTRLKRDA